MTQPPEQAGPATVVPAPATAGPLPVSYYSSPVDVFGAAPRCRSRRHPTRLRHAFVVEEVGEDPTHYLVLGSDRAGNLLVLDRPAGPIVIQAMG